MKKKYTENPKTTGSGIMCCIPQSRRCPLKCKECFFQSGRSYLEPLEENLPNVPSPLEAEGFVVRVNDGNDSWTMTPEEYISIDHIKDRFFNTSLCKGVERFKDEPVVLTVNPRQLLDHEFKKLKKSLINLMFVRVLTNTWNLEQVVDPAVEWYTSKKVPVVLTFMAYHELSSIPVSEKDNYVYRTRTKNSYWAITTEAFRKIVDRYKENVFVYTCGKIEGKNTSCVRCGNCLREYFATKARLKKKTRRK